MDVLSQIVDVKEEILLNHRSESLLAIGFDSLKLTYLHSCFEGNNVSILDLYRCSIEEIASMRLSLPTSEKQSSVTPFPLTEMQKSFWIGRFGGEEGTPCQVYNEFDFEDLNIDVFCDAIRATVAKHDMLRARMTPELEQVTLPMDESLVNLFPVPSSLVSDNEKRNYCESYHMSHPNCFWSIHYESLPNRHIRLYVLVDLLFLDVRSIVAMVQEVAKFYNDLMDQPRKLFPQTSNDPPSFRGYVIAKANTCISTPTFSETTAMPVEVIKLTSLPPLLPQHGIKTIPNFSNRYHRREGMISSVCWTHLQSLCRHFVVTPTALLMTLFLEVLELYSEQRYFTVSMTSVDQDYRYVNTIGNFTSLLLVNNYYEASVASSAIIQSVWSKVRHIQEVIATQREVGFATLAKLKQLASDKRLLFPVVFTSLLAIDLPTDLCFCNTIPTLHYQQTRTPKVWFDLQVYELPVVSPIASPTTKETTLHFHCDYDQSIYSDTLVQEMLACYERLIDQFYQKCLLATTSKEEISKLQVKAALSPEIEALRIACNETKQSFTNADLTLHENVYNTLIASQADLSCLAIIDQDIFLSRRDLLRAVNRLSQQILKQLTSSQQFAQKDTRICLVLEKGWEQIVAILAVLVAGGTYVPINPSHPNARIGEIVEQVQSSLVIIQARNSHRWQEIPCPQLVIDESLLENGKEEEGEDHFLTWSITNRDITSIAYIIFTSGTEGRPKGVAIPHQGAVNTCLDLISRFQMTSSDRVFALSSYTFDLSVFDCFATLIAGGTIVMCKPDGTRDPDYWVQQIVKNQITIWNTVPTSFFMLIESNWEILVAEQEQQLQSEVVAVKPSILSSLRVIMLSGDAIKLSKLLQYKQQFFAHRGDTVLFACLGGSTEASIWSNYHFIPSKVEDYPDYYNTIESAPYGRPLANQTLYVLDESYEYRPTLVVGKIYIGGIGLAAGYYNNSVITNQKFIVHEKYGRIYETGDFGRYLPNGEIEIIGRRDQQVKIRGFRIELSEIEQCVERLSEIVKQAVVICRKTTANYLVGFVVLAAQANTKDNSDVEKILKAHCLKYLPDYMEVAKWIVVSSIPLSLNGKIDRKALEQQLASFSITTASVKALPLSPLTVVTSNEDQEIALVTKLETEILTCARHLLLDEQQLLQPTSKLMEFGMDSLLGVRFARELSKLYGMKLPSTLIFQYETVKEITEWIHSQARTDEK